MATYNVLDTMAMGKDTAVVVECSGNEFSNGIMIKDEKNQEYKLLSVGLVSGRFDEESYNKTTILIEGSFSSKKIIVDDF